MRPIPSLPTADNRVFRINTYPFLNGHLGDERPVSGNARILYGGKQHPARVNRGGGQAPARVAFIQVHMLLRAVLGAIASVRSVASVMAVMKKLSDLFRGNTRRETIPISDRVITRPC